MISHPHILIPLQNYSSTYSYFFLPSNFFSSCLFRNFFLSYSHFLIFGKGERNGLGVYTTVYVQYPHIIGEFRFVFEFLKLNWMDCWGGSGRGFISRIVTEVIYTHTSFSNPTSNSKSNEIPQFPQNCETQKDLHDFIFFHNPDLNSKSFIQYFFLSSKFFLPLNFFSSCPHSGTFGISWKDSADWLIHVVHFQSSVS